ncbi:MAG TPA: hypothetical protein VGD17_17935 [Chitinophagaceae bacterium]
MKYKIAAVLTMLVLASLITFSNRCKPSCDGRTMIVMSAFEAEANEPELADEAADDSPLFRLAITL